MNADQCRRTKTVLLDNTIMLFKPPPFLQSPKFQFPPSLLSGGILIVKHISCYVDLLSSSSRNKIFRMFSGPTKRWNIKTTFKQPYVYLMLLKSVLPVDWKPTY